MATIIEQPAPEPVAEAEAETPNSRSSVETAAELADAATEVAQIEAAKEIAVAEIDAETQRHAIDTGKEVAEKDADIWRQNIEARMELLHQNQSETQSTLQGLTQAVQSLANPKPELAKSEVMLDNREVQEAPEPAKPKRKAKFRLI